MRPPALAALAAAALFPAAATAAAPGADGAALFQRCAACHLADGAGVPGAFPPLRAQVGRYAAVWPGRLYLVSVLTHGLTGPIRVGGAEVSGFMPPQSLSDDEAAAVLNHVVHRIAAPASRARPFTAAEVADLRRGREGATAQGSRALRPDALAARP